jgi:hypothetical protein
MVCTRPFRIDRVRYVNPTGLAEDAANYFKIQVLNEALVAFEWSTETGQEGTLTGGTWVIVPAGAGGAAAASFVKDEELDFNFDETGTATLPAGTIVLECSYL